jgi:predicted ATPase with chaperone activity
MFETTLTLTNQLQRTGVRRSVLDDLALKILYLGGEMSLVELSERICLDLAAVDDIFQFLRKEQLCEVKGMSAGSHRITASVEGKRRAAELATLSPYAGPAPVSLSAYCERVRAQSIVRAKVTPADLARAFQHLVLDQEILSRLGTAIVSGTSIFLHGPSGTGKTTIAGCIPDIYGDGVWIPYAVEINGQIISIYDPVVHRIKPRLDSEEVDKRWVYCTRPTILSGGELSAEMLDIQFSPFSRVYTAPLQMKANDGVLILDDFGRQRMGNDELLNRWMTPLDRRVDFLTLPSGAKFEIPFELFVVFSTNLDPSELVDAAFLRRIPNKIKLDYATQEQFLEIFRRECMNRAVLYEAALAEHTMQYVVKEMNQPLCQCYPRDLLNQIVWAAKYSGEEPVLSRKALERACRNYFLTPTSAAG